MFEHYNAYEMTLSNFNSSKDFFDVANKLNHVVDRRRVFQITDTKGDNIKCFSLEDPEKTITSIRKDKILFKFKYFNYLVPWDQSPRHFNVGDVGDTFYKINVANVDDGFVPVAFYNPCGYEGDPQDVQGIIDTYNFYLDQCTGRYNYVSFANIKPSQTATEQHVLDFDGYKQGDEFLIEKLSSDDDQHYEQFLKNYWGITDEPRDQCEYNLASQTITFGFDIFALDNSPESRAMRQEFSPYVDRRIKMSPTRGVDSDEPKLLALMTKLSCQTGATFDITIREVNPTSWRPFGYKNQFELDPSYVVHAILLGVAKPSARPENHCKNMWVS